MISLIISEVFYGRFMIYEIYNTDLWIYTTYVMYIMSFNTSIKPTNSFVRIKQWLAEVNIFKIGIF